MSDAPKDVRTHVKLVRRATDPHALEEYHEQLTDLATRLRLYSDGLRDLDPRAYSQVAQVVADTMEHLQLLKRRAVLIAYDRGDILFRSASPTPAATN